MTASLFFLCIYMYICTYALLVPIHIFNETSIITKYISFKQCDGKILGGNAKHLLYNVLERQVKI